MGFMRLRDYLLGGNARPVVGADRGAPGLLRGQRLLLRLPGFQALAGLGPALGPGFGLMHLDGLDAMLVARRGVGDQRGGNEGDGSQQADQLFHGLYFPFF